MQYWAHPAGLLKSYFDDVPKIEFCLFNYVHYVLCLMGPRMYLQLVYWSLID